jgi:diguanylate cyclase
MAATTMINIGPRVTQERQTKSDLPSVVTLTMRHTQLVSLVNNGSILLLAALWHQFMPIQPAWLLSLSSLVLLALPLVHNHFMLPLFVRQQTRQLEQVVDAIEQVAGGNFNVDLSGHDNIEMQRLRQALQFMISRLRSSIKSAEKLAYRDHLTGIANRLSFKSEVKEHLECQEPEAPASAVLYFDLDRFKAVNDTLGHAQGDRLIEQFTTRVDVVLDHHSRAHHLRHKPLFARMGGDEFSIYLHEVGQQIELGQLANSLLASLEEPFSLGGNLVTIGASIGIATAPQDGDTYDILLRNADHAMLFAKKNGKRNAQFFNSSMNDNTVHKLDIESQLRVAINSGEFDVAYQPQMAGGTRAIVGAEALVRWRHPVEGVVTPDRFIGIAEEAGIVGEIGLIVLRKAVAQAMLWLEMGQPLRVSVNISALQIQNRDFASEVRAVLRDFKLPPELLELEITETLAMQDSGEIRAQLARLRTIGVSIAIDDFGTGYSNLGLLRRLKLDRLKIDRSFVNGIETDEEARMIISTIMAMAHALDYEVVAEGVETESQAVILETAGCAILQGYHFSRPISAAAFDLWRANQQAQPERALVA